jgi:hypothetical protein
MTKRMLDGDNSSRRGDDQDQDFIWCERNPFLSPYHCIRHCIYLFLLAPSPREVWKNKAEIVSSSVSTYSQVLVDILKCWCCLTINMLPWRSDLLAWLLRAHAGVSSGAWL